MDAERRASIVALGHDPVSPGSPAGDPVRYEEVFERLQSQMDRLGSLTGEAVEWSLVVELASQILRSRSKDLLVLSYLVLGLFEHEGYRGLAAGLEACREFLGNFWQACYPKLKPPHGRYNAVQYLADKILPRVALKAGRCAKMPSAAEKEAVHDCAALLGELDKAVQQAFAGLPDTPNLLPLLRAFGALKEKVGPLGAAPAAAGGEPPAGAPAGEAAPAAGFATPAQAAQAAVRVARYLLSQDEKDPRGYRLMRAVHFGALSAAPRDRLLPPPPPPRRLFLQNAAGSGNWPALLSEAEGQFAGTPLWLDLQRYVATALNGLGPAYAAAKAAVELECFALHARLPELFERSFKDGTPFADGATRAWLTQVRGRYGAGARASGADGDALARAVGQARKLLSEAKAPEAVARLAGQVGAAGSRRERFRAQLALAELCLELNKLTLTTALLEGLEKLVDQYRLEEWEPELAARAMRDLYQCLCKARPKPTPDDARRSAAVFARLCRLDPAAALKLDSAGPG